MPSATIFAIALSLCNLILSSFLWWRLLRLSAPHKGALRLQQLRELAAEVYDVTEQLAAARQAAKQPKWDGLHKALYAHQLLLERGRPLSVTAVEAEAFIEGAVAARKKPV